MSIQLGAAVKTPTSDDEEECIDSSDRKYIRTTMVT